MHIGTEIEVNNIWRGVVIKKEGNILILKLKNGYNIALEISKKDTIKIIKKVKKPKHKPVKMLKKLDKKKSHVAILSTGGTISSKIDYTTGAIHTSYSAKDLINTLPEIADYCYITSKCILNRMSEDMTSKDWKIIAREVFSHLKNSEGIVITHGTDTLVYTSAMLSFMIQNLNKPIVLTYAQKSSDRASSDAFMNLLCACIFATKDVAEVTVVGHANMSDDYCHAIRGTRVRKMHSSRRDAFRPINDLPLANIYPNGKIEIINNTYNKRRNIKPVLDTKINDKVAIFRFYANASPNIIDYFIKEDYKGIIIQGTGLGHVSVSQNSFIPHLKNAIDNGIFVAMTSQEYGRVNPYVYSNLRKIAESGVVYLEDMTTEVAYAKLMWVLGHTRNLKKIKKLMLTNFANEISKRIDARAFLC